MESTRIKTNKIGNICSK